MEEIIDNKELCDEGIEALKNEENSLLEYKTSNSFVAMLVAIRLSEIDTEIKKLYKLKLFL